MSVLRVQSVSKTTLRFSDLLKGFTELRKVIILRVMVYCNKRIQIKISNGKKHMHIVQKSSRRELPVFLSQWSHVDSTYFSQHRILPNREGYLNLEVQGFYWRSAT